MLSWHAVTPGHLANLITPMNVGTTHNKMKRWILDIADVRMVTGDVDIVEYSIGRGMAPVHSGSTGTQPSNIKIIYLSRTSVTLLLVRAVMVTWRWRVAVRWGHWSAGIQWLRVTRHQDHDTKHMPAHSSTGQATHLHRSSPGLSANNNNDFIFCQMSRRLSYCSTEKR